MNQKIRAIVLVGGPGSGKGTQGHLLGALPGFLHVSSGDIFRGLDPLGEWSQKVRPYASKGELAPDDLSIEIWLRHMQGLMCLDRFLPQKHILVSDGIPRNAAQARLLKPHLDVLRVINLQVPEPVMRARTLGRAQGRADDREEVINKRIRIYQEETVPLLKAYDTQQIATVNADQPLVEVARDVLGALPGVV